MRIKLLIALCVCFVLLSVVLTPAVKACCDPPCNDCQNCVEDVCQKKPGVDCDEDSDCNDCQVCEDCSCVEDPNVQCDDDTDCADCQVCEDCSCVKDPNVQCDDDTDCGDPNCWDCIDCNCVCDITINSVSSVDYACVGCNVTFTASVTGNCSCVNWSGGGGDPNTGCTFITKWDTTGVKTVTATPACGDSAKQKQVTIVAVASLLPDEGTEIDDGDGDPNTTSYAVCIADTGVVTVTATPDPSVSEENLPACWTLTGGTGSGKLSRTVDKTTAGVTTITCSCNTSSKTTKIYVVEVASLLPDQGTEFDDGDADPNTKSYLVPVAATGIVTVTATPNPSLEESKLPPCWSLTGGTGSGKLERTVDKTTSAKTIITCTAGSSSKTTTIYVYKVQLKSIKFTSDHGLLKDNNSDWTDSGTVYSEPEWVNDPATNNPISQTKNTSLMTDVTVKVEPLGLEFDLAGDGLDNYVDFTETGITSTGSDQIVTINADAALVNQVDTLTKSISWTIKLTDPDPDIEEGVGSSGPHKIYVTYGTPSGSVVTEKRIIEVCTAADGQTTDSGVASAVQGVLHSNEPPYFQGGTGPAPCSPIWLMMNDSPQYPGDCIAHANLMKHAVKLLGISASYAHVADATNQPSENAPSYQIYWCETNSRNERRYFQEKAGGLIWNFEGVCGVGSIYYDVAWSTTSGTYTYCKTEGNGIGRAAAPRKTFQPQSVIVRRSWSIPRVVHAIVIFVIIAHNGNDHVPVGTSSIEELQDFFGIFLLQSRNRCSRRSTAGSSSFSIVSSSSLKYSC